MSFVLTNQWSVAQNTPFPSITSSDEVGIGTTTPDARLHVSDGNNTTTGSSVLFEGNIGNTPTIGAGRRFMWIPNKGALRVGLINASQFPWLDPATGNVVPFDITPMGFADDFWDEANIGEFSYSIGAHNLASGLHSHSYGALNRSNNHFAFTYGLMNTAGLYSTAFGISNTNTGYGGFSVGESNTITNGERAFTFGYSNTLTDLNSFASGLSNTVSTGGMAFGRFLNVTNGTIAIGNSNAGITTGNPAIEFGIGANKNGLTLYQDGKVQFNELPGTGNFLSIDVNGFLSKTNNGGLWNEESPTHISYQNEVTIGSVETYRPTNTNLWVNGLTHSNGITLNNPNPSALFNDETQKLTLNNFGNQSWISFSGTDLTNNNGNGLRFQFVDASNNYTNIMNLKHNGNVGIGIDDPTRKLQVNGTVYFNSFDGNLVVEGNETVNGKVVINSNLPSAFQGQLEIKSNAGNAQAIQLTDGTKTALLSHNNGNTTLISSNDVSIWNGGKFTVQNNGFETRFLSSQVVIGNNEMTFSPDQNAKLHVDGKAVFKEAVVRPDGWSDFVFDENYKLLPLNEVRTFIQENKHLPDVPSEKQVKEEGVSVGEMDAILLQKIEELTLYVLQLEEEINILKTK